MAITSLLLKLHQMGVKLSTNDNKDLILDLDVALLDDALRESINIHKNDLITLLNRINSQKENSYSGDGSYMEEKLVLLPAQKWFFAQQFHEKNKWNIAAIYRTSLETDLAILKKAVISLALQHPSLRTLFRKSSNNSWEPVISDVPAKDICHLVELDNLKDLTNRLPELQNQLNLADGPLFKLGVIKVKDDESIYIHILAHHLICDGFSIGIILEDLQSFYYSYKFGHEPNLSKTISVFAYANLLDSFANSRALEQEVGYWQRQPWEIARNLPADYSAVASDNIVSTSETVQVKLESDLTKLLFSSLGKLGKVQLIDALLAALLQSVSEWSQRSAMAVLLVNSGRAIPSLEVDLSRTTGWLALSPIIFLNKSYFTSVIDQLKDINKQISEIPNYGLHYDLLHFLKAKSDSYHGIPAIEDKDKIVFNYLGVVAAEKEAVATLKIPLLFQEAAPFNLGANQSEKNNRLCCFMCKAYIQNDEFFIEWGYSRVFHKRETVERLASCYISTLREIAMLCKQSGAV